MSRASQRYLALGDSFTIGTGVGAERSFPAELVRRWQARGLDVELTNPAANGYTTDALIAHELPLVREIQPTLVTLLIGANDIVLGSDGPRYRSQVRRILEEVVSSRVPVAALYGLPQPDWSLSPKSGRFGTPEALRASITAFNAILRDEVKGVGGSYVDLFPLMRRQAEAGMFAADGVHPSAEALAEWATALEERLVRT